MLKFLLNAGPVVTKCEKDIANVAIGAAKLWWIFSGRKFCT